MSNVENKDNADNSNQDQMWEEENRKWANVEWVDKYGRKRGQQYKTSAVRFVVLHANGEPVSEEKYATEKQAQESLTDQRGGDWQEYAQRGYRIQPVQVLLFHPASYEGARLE
jgi:hypothetical protein